MFLGALDLRAHPNEFLGAFIVGTAHVLFIVAALLYSIADCTRGHMDDNKHTAQGKRQRQIMLP